MTALILILTGIIIWMMIVIHMQNYVIKKLKQQIAKLFQINDHLYDVITRMLKRHTIINMTLIQGIKKAAEFFLSSQSSKN